MRVLNMNELQVVSGGRDDCPKDRTCVTVEVKDSTVKVNIGGFGGFEHGGGSKKVNCSQDKNSKDVCSEIVDKIIHEGGNSDGNSGGNHNDRH